jgi:hypothetical protein
VDGARRLVRRNTPLGRLGDMHQVQVPTDPAGEADGPIPARGLGKHQVGPCAQDGNSQNSGAQTTGRPAVWSS